MRYTAFALVLAMLGGTLILTACDDDSREIKYEEKVDVRRDGTVEKKTETERLSDDGTVIKEERKEEVNR